MAERLTGKPQTKQQLLDLLDEVKALIEVDDSWEGLVNWLMPEPGDPPDTYARVEARYRVGNAMGQGGFRILGDWVDEKDHVVKHVDPSKGL